jgi:superfamily II RNA helicase
MFLTIPDLSIAPLPQSDAPPSPAIDYPFTLDNWQQHAISAIDAGKNVIVTAKTGSGKTLVGEYQIATSLRRGGRVFYTTPIKSLSNQKYHDLKHLFPHASVGIMTGDIKSNPEASVVVMTTEILRNLLFKQSTATAHLGTAGALTLDGLDAVVFDEVHYINDRDRGHVWEETLILLPPAVKLVLLSATIDSPADFARWLGDAKQRPIVLLSTTHRIVPLIHGVWDPTAQPLPLRALKDGDEAPYKAAAYGEWLRGRAARERAADEWGARVAAAAATGDSVAGATGKVKIHSFTHTLNQAVSVLNERDLLPALFFVFSRRDAENYAAQVNGSLIDGAEASAVRHIIRFHLHRYKDTIEHLPQYHMIMRLLERGIAFHHSGLLPLLKEIVELLFSKGYVRALFCTETFAVGLNMPARTVVFLDLKKPADGGGWRLLRADEYTQMAGRAGRRGKDAKGVVIYLPARVPLSADEMHALYTSALPSFESRLSFHYDFILKALHASQSASQPLWESVIDGSYWSALRARAAAEADAAHAAHAAAAAAIPLSAADAAELRAHAELTATFKTSVNAERRRAAAALDRWRDAHAGPRWRDAQKLFETQERERVAAATAAAEAAALRADGGASRVAPVLDALEDWGAIRARSRASVASDDGAVAAAMPRQTPFGALATEVNEGNPLLVARLFESQIHADATCEEIITILGAFIVDKEALDATVHPYDLPPSISDCVKKILLAVETWTQEGIAIDARYGISSPPEYWCLATFWVEITADWLAGASAASLVVKYGIYEGNLMRGLYKLANLVNEWICLATFAADVDALEKIKNAPQQILRDIAVPESLYLRL